jgi:hypothetical protein
MTSALLDQQPRPRFWSLAIFVLLIHLALTSLILFAGQDEQGLEISQIVFAALLPLIYLIVRFSVQPYLSDFVFSCLFLLCWLTSAVLWSGIVAGSVVALQRLKAKSSNQSLQPTAPPRH